jgi:hypothetical protein
MVWVAYYWEQVSVFIYVDGVVFVFWALLRELVVVCVVDVASGACDT